MNLFPSDVAFTDSVKAVQLRRGSRTQYARMEQGAGWQTCVTSELREFLEELDMFYLGTSSLNGQPYIQYRGGSPGFLKVVDETTLGFADFAGNRQFITLGNLTENPQAFLFLIDYIQRRRVKLWGTARIVEDDPDLLARLRDVAYPARVERAILFSITAWDVNCSQHIHPRLPQADLLTQFQQLREENEMPKTERDRFQAKRRSSL
ncbi:pyridoxamine 5'-phosphate oxidase family protein [Gimesia panareensis]|uniref:pyridoxamine 5'-phosphate oxidase family protein n=1 Tax=Gimesia panareensis TaxID=2527978 RepID=UPI00118BB949|nr:pyridoxamine 5'-phosphate oxidase family protein [Gimesia panareensis]QDU51694.1 Pyridoxamine 5'-phosphate oxidase [Gimesia panareensis]